jgi:hypothetical protein
MDRSLRRTRQRRWACERRSCRALFVGGHCQNWMMADSIDLVQLRELVRPVVSGIAGYTHRQLEEECTRRGLPEPPPEGEGSKAERVAWSFAALQDWA